MIVCYGQVNLTVSIESTSVDTNGRPLVCIPSVESTTCVPIFLERIEYIYAKHNNGRTFIWQLDNVNYIVEGHGEVRR